jgi:heme oxygenase
MDEEFGNSAFAFRGSEGTRARISVGLRNLSRECRREILSSHAYRSLRLGAITRDGYVLLLRANYDIRRTLEELLASLGGASRVENLLTDETKTFSLQRYVTGRRCRSHLLRDDLVDLTGEPPDDSACSAVATPITEYMTRVRDVYSIALLGVLYMLEETVVYAGPRIAHALTATLGLAGKGTRYLRGMPHQRADFRDFRRSLDLITDIQTQVNIVVASSITYGMYRELLKAAEPLAIRSVRRLH